MAEELSSASGDGGNVSPESSPFAVPQISLPKGGGAIRGIGEKFAANAATGTGSLAVPIALSQGRSGFGPQLSLSHDSGAGNGPHGLGWSLSLPAITLKTDKGLPRFCDSYGEQSDVYILSSAEDLVPVLREKEYGEWVPDEFEREGYRVRPYRPRIEGLFSQIERWTRLEDGDVHWRSISKDNILTVYGRTWESRIVDPHNQHHVFSWLVCESYDDKGNAIVYEYVSEDDHGIDLTRPSERDRLRTANRYLKRIRYGNRRPLLLDVTLPSFRSSHISLPPLATVDWMFEAVLDYDDGHYRQDPPDDDGRVRVHASPNSQPGHHWPVRQDPFSSYRSGFEVRTYRLCRRVLMFHHFPDELGADDYIVRSTEFEYHEKPIGSFITRIIQSGYTLQRPDYYLKKSLPALELAYTSSPLEDPEYQGYHLLDAEPDNLPAGIDGENYKWVDLDGEGISGVLTEQGESWYYKPNAGCGRFRPLELVGQRPSLAALNQGKQQLLDLAGDGQLDLVQLNSSTPGFYERTFDEGWGSFRTFRSFPVLNWEDPNLRFVDVTGDGIADVLITEDDAFTWHRSLLDHGFGPAVRVAVPDDEREGPHVVFAGGTQSIYLADMSGDGLSDLVRIRNGEVCYWPNLGYGKFGRKVIMDNSPWFEDLDLFDQKRIRLADTDGSGTTDIVYLGSDSIKIFLNHSGNGWSDARDLKQFPPANDLTSVSVVDLLGRGTACLLWSSRLPGDSGQPLRYVDLMNGQKPHLLTTIRNNLGAETQIEYGSSTEFYLADKRAGTPWVTRLPFPVHVVKKVETFDYISRNRFVTSYSYHHGYFDGVEREYRGFGRVDQLDTEEFATVSVSGTLPVGENVKAESNVPPVLTKTWFHTGVYLKSGRISRHLEHEYWREPGLSDEEHAAMLLDDTTLPANLTAEEAREAFRSLKGSNLRQEIYALNESEECSRPYTVSEKNLTIKCLQHRETNRHAMFFTHERETVSFNYERKLYKIDGNRRADPRVKHSVTLEVDGYGNILKSVNVVYGRRFREQSRLFTDADRKEQQKLLLTLTTNTYTNAVREAHAYRNPVLAQARLYELLHIMPAPRHFGVTNLFRFQEIAGRVAQASDGLHDLPFEDVENRLAVEEVPYRRLLKRSRTNYRSNALDRLLPVGELESLALPGESYKLCFTPGLLHKVYRRVRSEQAAAALIPDAKSALDEGGYADLDSDDHWWARSGRVFYSPGVDDNPSQELAHARRRFFLPKRFCDGFGNVSTVEFDAHDILLAESRDPVGNSIRVLNDYRVLSPKKTIDPNGNRSEIAFDALGMVAGTAVMGKEGEHLGDSLEGFVANLDELTILDYIRHPLRNPWEILREATTRLVYDLFAYERTRNEAQPQPAVVYTMARETHAADLKSGGKAKVQHSFSYSDGFGREIQKKLQAEAGPLPDRGPEISRRWVGSGWTIYNNKGKPVRQYEPFFSSTHAFEFATIVGVSPILVYDAVERVVATIHPNHTFEKVVFDPWRQQAWDVNDTVLEGNPASDVDVGGFLKGLPMPDYLPTWYEQRATGQMGPAEQTAAEKSAVHAKTPAIGYLDSLGRTFLGIAHNRFLRDDSTIEEYFATHTQFDIQGDQLCITDALDRRIISYDYDMFDRQMHQDSADAGERWTLNDILGKPVQAWTSRGYEFHYKYDGLRRPTDLLLKTEDSQAKLIERARYGEQQPEGVAHNLRTRLFQQFDGAGVLTNSEYDFKGNLLTSSRQLLAPYRELEVDWSASPGLEERIYTSNTTYDALNRVVTSTTPDASTIRPQYNEANLLDRVDVNLRGAEDSMSFVSAIDYNAKGQREFVAYGNGARTHYEYDPLTSRLISLETKRHGQSAELQGLSYTYDPAGNVMQIRDAAQENVYFKNQVVSPGNRYTYDALYRLIAAEGREHIGQRSTPQSDFEDSPRIDQPLPGDGSAMRRYHERYHYDGVGNILGTIHSAANGNWTRRYTYDEQHAHPHNNQLTSTQVGELHEQYAYDSDGNMTRMPHLTGMEWDAKDELHATHRQFVKYGGCRKTYYLCNSAGLRICKITEHAEGRKAHERIYLGNFELYREYSHKGETKLERESLHVMDDKQRIALVETKTVDQMSPAGKSPITLTRYQFSNHLDSSTLELDESAEIISYEEYYPFGGTSYESVRSQVEVSPKRYRYTGKERDEETELYYHGARYYVPWLGRWTSTDPTGIKDGVDLYLYCRNNPIKLLDKTGSEGEEAGSSNWDRALGGLKMVGGALETVAGAGLVVAGAATSEFGVGIAIAGLGVLVTAHGADTTVSGGRTMWNGKQIDSFTSQGLQAAGMSRTGANLTDAAISVAGTLGANAITKAPQAAAVIASEGPSVTLSQAAGAPSAMGVTNPLGYAVGHSRVAVDLGEGAGPVWSHLTVPGADRVMSASGQLVESGTAIVSTSAAPKFASIVTIPVTADEARTAQAVVSAALENGGNAGEYAFLANDCTTYATRVLNAAGVSASGSTPATLFVSAALRSEAPVSTLLTAPVVMQPVTATGAVINTAVGASSPFYSESSTSTTVSTASGIGDPTKFHSFDEFQAASSGPYTQDYLMERWASVHGWVSSD